tara:strand:- start:688 stop:1374 length:687 start_codon:yes stop_codon:yes gene_type:complete
MTRRQYENQIRLIAVSEISKGFRKSGIIKAIIKIAKDKNHIASGSLINPLKSNSITPNADDQWLVRKKKKAVSVRVYNTKTGVPSSIRINTRLEYGIDERYYQLTTDSKKKKWFPNRDGINRLEEWVRQKSSRGVSFTLPSRGKGRKKETRKMDVSNAVDVTRVAFAIANGIKKKGIKNRSNFFNPFKSKKNGVKATLNNAELKINDRLTELFTSQATISIDRLIKTL